MAEETIEELLARVSLRDRAAFSILYDRTSAKLFGVAVRILNDHAESEDALQTAYANVWRRASSFERGRASAMTWLIAIARNAAIDALRRRGAGVYGDERQDERASDDPTPEEFAETASEHAALRRCLDELEERQKDVVTTAFFHGKTYAEVAEASSTPLGTVKSWVRRSLLKLRECLERAPSEGSA